MNPPIIRTIVAYANYSRISTMTRASLERLKGCEDLSFDVVLAQGSNIVRNRNAAINSESSCAIHQKIPFDYLLCLDSDIAFTADDVRRLLSHGLDIVGGAYQKRERIDLMCAGYWYEGIAGISSDASCPGWREEGPKKVDWIGSGFLLMKKEVLERMEFPWFRYELVRFQQKGVPQQMCTSDDFGLAMNAVRAGYEIWLDCSCKLEHIALKTAGILPDLPAAEKIGIIEEELEKLEKEIYRTAIELQAAQKADPAGKGAVAKRLQKMNDTKFSYIEEMERIKDMRVR
jgi:hypothetical protein